MPPFADGALDGCEEFRSLIALVLVTPIGVLGWQRPRIAGVMLIALPVLPTVAVVTAAVQGLGPQGWPIAVLTAPHGAVLTREYGP